VQCLFFYSAELLPLFLQQSGLNPFLTLHARQVISPVKSPRVIEVSLYGNQKWAQQCMQFACFNSYWKEYAFFLRLCLSVFAGVFSSCNVCAHRMICKGQSCKAISPLIGVASPISKSDSYTEWNCGLSLEHYGKHM